MTTPDPEPRRIEPTGEPGVDVLIDAMVCPSCRTIYNAAKAKCDDPWHYDNQPDVTPYAKVFATGGTVETGPVLVNDGGGCVMPTAEFRERLRVAMATQRITVLPPVPELAQVDVDNAWNRGYERGVAEGRRQTTEGSAVPEHLAGDGPCHDCGAVNIRWFADSPLWNLVMGGPDATDDPGGIVCVRCFVRRADTAGFNPSAWRLSLPVEHIQDGAR